MEAPSGPHLHHSAVCHCVACLKEGLIAGEGIGIWSDVGNDMVIYDGVATCDGALTDVVNGVFEERSGDGDVFLAIGRVDVRVGCPECSLRFLLGASSLVNGAFGGADGGTNHPCCTSYHLSCCHDRCCYVFYYGVCSCPFCPESGVCGCYGDGLSGGHACADLIRVSSCPRSGMFYEGLV